MRARQALDLLAGRVPAGTGKHGEHRTRHRRGSGSRYPLTRTQLACYDYLYYVRALEVSLGPSCPRQHATHPRQPFELEHDYSPMWRKLMMHAHWNSETISLAQRYLHHTLKLHLSCRSS